jgi:hypothetical protein
LRLRLRLQRAALAALHLLAELRTRAIDLSLRASLRLMPV